MARITSRIKSEHFSRGIAVREALNKEISLIEKNKTTQSNQLQSCQKLKSQVQDNAHTLCKYIIILANFILVSADKFENIQEKQIELEVRIAKLLRSQSSGPLSKAESEAGRELRAIDRQLAQFEKSIRRVKNIAKTPQTSNEGHQEFFRYTQ